MSPKELTKRTINGLAWSLSTLLTQTLLNVVSVSILARLLAPHDYGVMSAAMLIVALGTMLSGLGLGPTIIQRKTLDPAHVAVAFIMSFCIGALLAVAQYASASLIAAFLRIPELAEVTRVLAWLTMLQSFNMLFEALLSRSMAFRNVSVTKLCTWILAIFGVTVPLAFQGYGYWALVFGTFTQTVLTLLAFAYFARAHLALARPTMQSIRDLGHGMAGFSATQFMSYIATYADNTIVARYLGATDLGIYSRAFFLISMPANMFGNVNRMVVFPAMAQIQDDEQRLKNAYLAGLSLSALVAIPTSVFLIVFADRLVDIILGTQWTRATVPFTIFSAAIYFRVGYKTCTTIIQAKGWAYWLAISQSLYAATIVGGAIVASGFGLNYVCLVVVGATVMNFCAYAYLGGQLAKTTPADFLEVHIKPLCISVFIAVVGYSVKWGMSDMPAYFIVSAGIILIGVPLLITLYLKPLALLNDHTARVTTNVMSKISPKFSQKLQQPIDRQ